MSWVGCGTLEKMNTSRVLALLHIDHVAVNCERQRRTAGWIRNPSSLRITMLPFLDKPAVRQTRSEHRATSSSRDSFRDQPPPLLRVRRSSQTAPAAPMLPGISYRFAEANSCRLISARADAAASTATRVLPRK